MRHLAIAGATAALLLEAVNGGPAVEAVVGRQLNGTDAPYTVPAGAFQINQVENRNHGGPNGLEAMLMAYIKYNKSMPPDFAAAVKGHTDLYAKYKGFLHKRTGLWATVIASPPLYYDSQYVVPITIGTPGEVLHVSIDTGSTDTWVFSTDTPPEEADQHELYHPASSSTSQILPGLDWTIRYGDGSSAAGIVYHDRLQVGRVYALNQSIQSATELSPIFTSDSFSSGIMGLGMSLGNSVQPVKQATFMQNIMHSLALPLFTANLRKGQPGNYNFGYISPLEFTGLLQWVPVLANSAYWKFLITGYQIGTSGTFIPSVWAVIADTGTTLLLLPDQVVNDYYDSVDGAVYDPSWGAIVFPCTSALPAYVFGIGLYRGVVPGDYLNYGQISDTYCYGGMQSSASIGISIVGDILLKAQFVVFDLGSVRMGFANKKLSS